MLDEAGAIYYKRYASEPYATTRVTWRTDRHWHNLTEELDRETARRYNYVSKITYNKLHKKFENS